MRFRFGLCCLVILFLFCTTQSTIWVERIKPAGIYMPGVRKIAVVDFKGPEQSGSHIASLLQSKLLETQYFEILERDRLTRILDEQKLTMTGIMNEATASKIGKLLGVDALVFGEVTLYQVEPDELGSEKVEKKEGTGKYEWVEEKNIFTGKKQKVKREIMRTVWVDQYYRIRRGTVAVNFRVVDVETGRLLVAHSDSKSYSSGKVVEGSYRELKPAGEILQSLSSQLVDKFVSMIAPHKVSERRMLESGTGKISEGKKFAQAGLWDEAIACWKKAIQTMPKVSSGYYNLGIAYEIKGDLDKAETLFKKAASLNQKKLYMEAIARVRHEKEEQVKLKEQLQK